MSLPPLLSEWAASRGIELRPRDHDGRIAFNVDDAYRVYLYPAPDNRLLIESRVCDLPTEADARRQLVMEALEAATGRIRGSAARLAVDAEESVLVLQAEARTDDGLEPFTSALGGFINSLADWRLRLAS